MNVLLLRGLIRSQFHWGHFAQHLRSSNSDLNPFFLDFPGTGLEFRRTSPASIEGIRADIRARFKSEREKGILPSGPWALVAMSMGGMVGIDWVNTHPEDFRKFVLINSSAKNVGGIQERFNLPALPRMR
ncbi:MAG: alpha/beta hydrolase, partial [Proteobacteria bacterium]